MKIARILSTFSAVATTVVAVGLTGFFIGVNVPGVPEMLTMGFAWLALAAAPVYVAIFGVVLADGLRRRYRHLRGA
jgi:hypothetical protein